MTRPDTVGRLVGAGKAFPRRGDETVARTEAAEAYAVVGGKGPLECLESIDRAGVTAGIREQLRVVGGNHRGAVGKDVVARGNRPRSTNGLTDSSIG